MEEKLKITFARGARRVTGSNFLVEAGDTKILIDCGLSQGEKFCESVNRETFSYDPKTINAVFFTHAHADHIGLFPRLVKEGFEGKAYTTAATRALMPIMLEDSVNILTDEATRCNEDSLYTLHDVHTAAAKLETVAYHAPIKVGDITVTLYNAGHILGSAIAVVEAFGTRVAFTGDLGRVPAILVPDREIPPNINALVTESVYGDRVHGSIDESKEILLETVRAVAAKGGTLLIPSFSLERTQIILSILDTAMTEGAIPKLPTYLDSPLAIKVTEVYRNSPEFLRDDIQTRMKSGDDPFSFPSLKVTERMQDSRTIDEASSPKIIIAGAGMSMGGRIRAHEARYLPDKNATLLIVGYQVAGSLGRRIRDGEKEVLIDGKRVQVKARVVIADGFSAHADRDDLMKFAEDVSPERVFVVLGESNAASFLAQRINGFLGIPVDVPREGETYTLN